jgi:hypothetical protein
VVPEDKYVMCILGSATITYKQTYYLLSYDLEYADGIGRADLTEDKTVAMTFDSVAEVFEAWKGRSKTHPDRLDGKPNRPLTAFFISVEKITVPE